MRKEAPLLLYAVRNTDITAFVYKLHIMAGDYLRDAEHNLRELTSGRGGASIALMSERHICLSDALSAYRHGADLNQRLFTSEFREKRAFLFRIVCREKGRAYGDVLLMDCAALRLEVEAHAVSPAGIAAVQRDGTKNDTDFAQWAAMDLCEKDALQSWEYRYVSEDVAAAGQRYIAFFQGWLDRAEVVSPAYLMERFNAEYMGDAKYPQWGMCRVPQETARQMLLHGDATVFRLTDGNAAPITPIETIKSGLWYSEFREFAIMPEDLPRLNERCYHEIAKLTEQPLSPHMPDKPLSIHER